MENIPFNEIIGGFGLFMFGIKFMGDGLKSVAGDKLRDYIDRYTSKPIMAVFIGIIITVLIQSSSATTAITIGLVRAGLMKLEQAAGIVMGANIGTTITSFLIGLNIEGAALYFVFIGAMLLVFGTRKKVKYIGEIFLGFGCLFYGLTIMGDALKGLSKLPEFTQFAETMTTQPGLGLFAGTIMTAIIQSSSAVIGIVQKIYETNIDILPFVAILPFVFGSNIGTTITGILASLGGSSAAKRTAAIHTFFNVIGTLIGMILLYPFAEFIVSISETYNISPMMQIAIAHIIFNLIATIVFFPLLKYMCLVVKKIIPGNDLETIDVNIDGLAENNLAHTLPSTALNVSKQAILKMNTVVIDLVKQTNEFLTAKKINSESHDIAMQTESLINSLDHKISAYLVDIAKEELTDVDFHNYNLNINVIKNYERIGDLSVNLIEFYEMINENKSYLSGDALTEIEDMYEIFYKMFDTANSIYENFDLKDYELLLKYENTIDDLEIKARTNHFKRMSKGECNSSVAGAVYCDILAVLERMADHCCNIARSVLEVKNSEKSNIL